MGRKIAHSWSVGDLVIYRQPYRSGWFVGEIASIGKMFATIDGERIHIPKISAKLKDPAKRDEALRELRRIDEERAQADKAAAARQRAQRQQVFDALCDRSTKA